LSLLLDYRGWRSAWMGRCRRCACPGRGCWHPWVSTGDLVPIGRSPGGNRHPALNLRHAVDAKGDPAIGWFAGSARRRTNLQREVAELRSDGGARSDATTMDWTGFVVSSKVCSSRVLRSPSSSYFGANSKHRMPGCSVRRRLDRLSCRRLVGLKVHGPEPGTENTSSLPSAHADVLWYFLGR